MKKRIDSSPRQPNRWHKEQLWREPFLQDRQRAGQVRQALDRIDIYPRYDLADNPNLAVMEANYRAALPDMIAALDRTDLAAVADLVRLLAIMPRPRHFFKQRRPGKYRRNKGNRL